MDQFTYAERATDWRGNNNIAESIFEQMALEEHPVPRWIVVGAGTGGTSATIGRYVRYRRHATGCASSTRRTPRSSRAGWSTRRRRCQPPGLPSRIEGIGRPRVEPSFVPTVIDRMIPVPGRRLGRPPCGSCASSPGCRRRRPPAPTCGACWQLIAEMIAEGRRGSVVTLLCDGGDRYADTYYNDEWLRAQGLDPAPHEATIRGFFASGVWPD